jgi:beta-glucanase (GH16 family)
MLGDNISSVGWPKCGEIDIMEMVGGGPGKDNVVHGTLHWDDGGRVCTCEKPNSSHTLSSGIFNDKFHVFTIIWDQANIKWYMDDMLFNTVNITPDPMTEFHADQFFIFNLAVGGNWPKPPDGTTVFPQSLIVDYVRVFQ